ncbi:hypothetical protein ACP4OV_001296 [Aristida adscensionis]
MSLAGILAASGVVLLLLFAPPSCHGATSHNISAILAAYPGFAEFSGALTSTGLAAEIDRRTTITVLAVDDAVMAQLRARRPQPDDFHRAISLHVLLDYYDDAKLHDINGGFAQVTSLYQASGKAPASAGIVNVTVERGGRVAFAQSTAASDAPAAVFYQKSVKESPYDIAVLQVSALISYPAAAAPAAAPAPAPAPGAAATFTEILSKNGCGEFAALVAATADAAATYGRRAFAGAGDGDGLTVFCPADKAVAGFKPTFKNLTADGQAALLLYHGVAAHYSERSLKAINGDVSTLASEGAMIYNLTVRADGDTVKLSSSTAPQSAARVTKTAVDKGPLAVYLIDAVLLPGDLPNNTKSRTAAAPSPAPASAPAPGHLHPAPITAAPTPAPVAAPAPASAPTPRRPPVPPPKEAPVPSPDMDKQPAGDDEEGQKNNGDSGVAPWSLGVAVAAAVTAIVLVL